MDDLISRQVLDLWNRYRPTIAVNAIKYDRELRRLLGTNLAEVGTDCISRQSVLDAITASINQYGGRYTTEQLNMWGLFVQMIQELPSALPDNSLQKLADEIAKYKRTMRSSNSDYFTGYMSALSMVEGMIADMMPHEPYEGVRE